MNRYQIPFPEDIKKIRKYLENFMNTKNISDKEINKMWNEFSENFFAAGWMIVDEKTLELFKEKMKFE